MSQAVRGRLPKRGSVVIHCGERPGDLRIKVERRPRGRREQMSLRVRSLVRKVKFS
jgi:hypothetical protein